VPLRLMGAVHALVLDRRAPLLATFYPSVGGVAVDEDARWRAFRSLVATRKDDLGPWLNRVPQTNEVGRAAGLLGALRLAAEWVGDLPVRLFEIGSSAGLNLWVDELPIGPGEAISTPMPRTENPVRVIERLGADLHPIDATSTRGRLQLTAYVWADDTPRVERLRTALKVAGGRPQHLVQQGAADFLVRLATHAGAVTVLWHSVVWQ